MRADSPVFDVLSKDLPIQGHHLLEASAGTGKTFSIENLVVRLLVEGGSEALKLEEILVVTFTKKATSELKSRVREKIATTILKLRSQKIEEDWLKALDLESQRLAVQQLQGALIAFHTAPIFTIHGFCQRMLSEEGQAAELMTPSMMLRIVEDFFRTQVTEERFSPAQLHLLLSQYRHDASALAKALCRLCNRGLPFDEHESFDELFSAFVLEFQHIKEQFAVGSDQLLELFRSRAPCYRKTANRQGELDPELEERAVRNARLFDQGSLTTQDFDTLILDDLVIVKALDPSNLRAKATAPPSSALLEAIELRLVPILDKARSKEMLLAKMAADCLQLTEVAGRQNHRARHDDILKSMARKLDDKRFCKAVKDRYRAAIIDEFQDTDPIQWEIFNRLFLAPEHTLYLVGDPKQSIYAFRSADIYTYLDAADAIGTQGCASLNTNWRATPGLVSALNTLFDPKFCPDLITLPRLNRKVRVDQVLAGRQEESTGGVEFFVARDSVGRGRRWPSEEVEQKRLMPFIATRLCELVEEGVSLDQCACLVRDRYQADALAEFLQKRGFATNLRRTRHLLDTLGPAFLRDILQAILDPQDVMAIKRALSTRWIGWDDRMIRHMEEQWKWGGPLFEKLLSQFYDLKRCLNEGGWARCYHAFLESRWHEDDQTVQERLLGQKGGVESFSELLQLSQLMVEYERKNLCKNSGLLSFFDQLKKWAVDDDDRIAIRQGTEAKAVDIVTLHASKGLEWEVVFALGLSSRTPVDESIMAVVKEGAPSLKAITDKSSDEYRLSCEESDAEKMRQLYVAMTRAKRKLYVPIVVDTSKRAPSIGSASPMELYLAKFNQPETDYQGIYDRITSGNIEAFEAFQRSLKGGVNIWLTPMESDWNACVKPLDKSTVLLEPPPSVKVVPSDKKVWSFTALARAKSEEGAPQVVPHDLQTFPAGPEVGSLLHSLFEQVPWKLLSQMDGPQTISSYFQGDLPEWQLSAPLNGWENEIAQMLYNTFSAPLLNEDSFCLADVKPNRQWREMEFFFPFDKKVEYEEIRFVHGYLRGFIDLFFEFEGKYYLVDWKSNLLEDYTPQLLRGAMEQHRYFLQASIYTHAMKRFLSLVEKRPFEECFGGVFYLFVRGIKDGGNGICHFFPEGDGLCRE